MKRLITTLLWATFLVGCGGGNSSNGGMTPNAQLNGSWHATLTSTASGRSSTVDVFILQNGANLSSDKISLGTTCSSVGTMSGSVSGNQVNMIITGNNGDTVSITGTASGGHSLFCQKQMASSERTGAKVLVCRRRRGRNDAERKRRGMRHSLTCARSYFV
jgi:hypothetical protein